MKLIILTLITVSIILSWLDFKKDMKNAAHIEDIRSGFVRFLLSIILFILCIIVFIF